MTESEYEHKLTTIAMMRERIKRTGVRASDMNHPGLLSDDDIANIDISKIYCWVRTGEWKEGEFRCWLRVMRVIE